MTSMRMRPRGVDLIFGAASAYGGKSTHGRRFDLGADAAQPPAGGVLRYDDDPLTLGEAPKSPPQVLDPPTPAPLAPLLATPFPAPSPLVREDPPSPAAAPVAAPAPAPSIGRRVVATAILVAVAILGLLGGVAVAWALLKN
jgi:hypothetical protein